MEAGLSEAVRLPRAAVTGGPFLVVVRSSMRVVLVGGLYHRPTPPRSRSCSP
jgi:hypothetical protein